MSKEIWKKKFEKKFLVRENQKFFPLHDGAFHFWYDSYFTFYELNYAYFQPDALAVWKVLVGNFIWFRAQVVVSRVLANTGEPRYQFYRDNPYRSIESLGLKFFLRIPKVPFLYFDRNFIINFLIRKFQPCLCIQNYLKPEFWIQKLGFR